MKFLKRKPFGILFLLLNYRKIYSTVFKSCGAANMQKKQQHITGNYIIKYQII